MSPSENAVCHALLTRLRNTLEMEWRERYSPNKREWDAETARHKVYADHRFQQYYETTGKPLPIFDDRVPHPPPPCHCEGCDSSAVVRMGYRTLVPLVNQALKRDLVDEMKSYFQIIALKCLNHDKRLHDVLTGTSCLHQYCLFNWQPLTCEIRESGVHFNVVSLPDAAHGAVLTLFQKSMGQCAAEDFEFNVIPECLTAFHWKHVK